MRWGTAIHLSSRVGCCACFISYETGHILPRFRFQVRVFNDKRKEYFPGQGLTPYDPEAQACAPTGSRLPKSCTRRTGQPAGTRIAW